MSSEDYDWRPLVDNERNSLVAFHYVDLGTSSLSSFSCFCSRSEAIGSDSILIKGFGEENQKHCDSKAFKASCFQSLSQTIGEKMYCVYYIAVKGVSLKAVPTLRSEKSRHIKVSE